MDETKPGTARYETHAEWCQHLARRGSLAVGHQRCQYTARCVGDHPYSVAQARRSNLKRAMGPRSSVLGR